MLKRASGRVNVLEIDGSEIHAVMPCKADWDTYTDNLFDRTEDGKLKTKSGEAIAQIYGLCVKKLVNVVGVDGKPVAEITNSKEIVDFLTKIDDVKAGQKIDGWLLGLADLNKEETKNSLGAPSAN